VRVPTPPPGPDPFPKAEIEKATSGDDMRPVLCEPYLRREGKGKKQRAYLYATDSYILARLPVEVEDDEPDGFVPTEVLKEARPRRGDPLGAQVTLTEDKAIVERNGRRLEVDRSKADVAFPDCAALIKGAEKRQEFSVTLNVDYLHDAAKALGARQIRLSFIEGDEKRPSTLQPVIVEPVYKHDDRIALVMPIRAPEPPK